MAISQTVNRFNQWLETFDLRFIETQDDVEQELIIPMFQHLGYPDTYRRDHYIFNTYPLTNQTIELKNVQIYFSTDDVDSQNAETSIILVQILAPKTRDLNQTITESKFFLNRLKPLFFIVTNGYNFKVYQCLQYRSEELIFDVTLECFKTNVSIGLNFFNKLNFDLLKQINKHQYNILNHSSYIIIENSLKRNRDLQEILQKNQFRPDIIRENNRLTVIKPQVLIECNLPQPFSQGNCTIEFSSNILRGLRIKLQHQDILGKLMTGLGTKPESGCRDFFKTLDENNFEVHLGQTTIILSTEELNDLCSCIDTVGQEYKNTIIEFENILETWNFEFTEFAGIRGFKLFSVEQRLWELMQSFATEFNYAQGKTEWHIFHQEETAIRISRGIRDHAFILPKFSSNLSLLPNSLIDIVYQLNDVHLQSLTKNNFTSWEEDIGARGTWTAKYTKQWLLERFIPQIVNHYVQQLEVTEVELLSKIINYQFEFKPLREIEDIRELLPYLRNIQIWLNRYNKNISATLLRPYYQGLTDLVRNTDFGIRGLDYILGTLQGVEWCSKPEELQINLLNSNFRDVYEYLKTQVDRIKRCDYESSTKADLITRTLIWIIEFGKISYSQAQLNNAKQAVLPIWELSRFELRHVYPYRFL
ncbi:MAG TPA: hypothetical protein VK184_03480 [Nostocaceae cyanobacterium]|nr:hypothetical protein [Nostocaceae cyanobacterium]